MIAVAFPGQGSQKVGMAQEISQDSKELFAEASQILGYDLLDLCNDGPLDKLSSTEFAQPALLVTCYALWRTVAKETTAKVFIGHSLGQITALVAAGAISFSDGVKIVAQRGKLMNECPAVGGMSAILGLEADQVEKLCQEASSFGIVNVANYNSPGQIVVSGERKALEHVGSQALEFGAKRIIPLAVSGPFHSVLMQPAAEEFKAFLNGMIFQAPQFPVVSNHRNVLITTASEIKQELVDQLTNSVQWINNIKLLESMGINKLVEVGPTAVLTGLTKRISKDITTTLVS